MKGRKPQVVDMKILKGNAGHRPLPSPGDDPFLADRPDKPAWLTGEASEEWDRLVQTLEPILSKAAAGMLVVACGAFADMREAEQIIATEGRFYETINKHGQKMKRPHPALQMLTTARNAYHKALTELGATPVSHSRVKKLKPNNQLTLPGVSRFFTA